ncbi:AraC family transcriptional regulator [Bacillus sp. Au-Bac7]|uniref:AraC family transcriptional regulator n=1 Tax=Bacillus sp. Au-Bac7 TaxID=2906458 RepID=UPI001E431024|nr:AraC family transcriptional regulator [Bacillus sp. Au-Bac7]MCE4047598.1 AraC family transcriptional regulator [Bacillus sp. Au-Bac7]
MQKTELMELLFTMSDRELYYKTNPDYYNSLFDSCDSIELNNQKVYVFKFNDQKKENAYSPPNPTLEIVKHSRYSTIPFHIHDYIEMNYVYAGTCTAIVQDKVIPLQCGDVCIMDTNVPHTICDAEEKDIIINILMDKSYFTASMLGQLSSNSIISDFILEAISHDRLHNRFLLFHCQNSDKLGSHVENLLCEFYEPSFCSKDIINAYMVLIFAEMLRHFQTDNNSKSANGKQNPILDILLYMEENFQSCTLQEVAQHFSFHPNYLSRLIKKSTGKSFKQLLQEQKLNKASYLLNHTSMTIAEILNEIGYQNHGFFNRIFKERYNVTPKEYQRNFHLGQKSTPIS